MTAPLTPPHQPPNDDPWQKGPSGATPWPGPEQAGDDDGPGLRAELVQAAVVAVVLAVLGVLLGLLWMWLAPRVPLISDGKAVYLKDSEGEQAIGGDGTFALLGLAFGVVSAAAVFLFRRRGGVPLVIALAVGGLLGSLLAWRVGIWLGPSQDVVAAAKHAGKGVTFDAPLKLAAKGALLAWPVAAMIVHLGVTAVFGPRDPEPEWTPPSPPATLPPLSYEDPAPEPGERR
ncbi:hypothetical protein ACIPW9_04215 [Streptomyces sp. NPDC090052]|uniref:hypothetical protein n=1 Tax=unclassified Streptomyces TaxID=2593676 RepID=UPI002255D39B|nr:MULTISPECIES: hypothetical protein [unclassified Streptomyces]MCX4727156.1 hypothetical protein [Streptomyces sp. NBC_01306]WSV03592.1 hypothetical protein OG372_08305 [Streptomyces sp. NBC_01020]WSX70404.1 hypothetical protein OG221_29510 [Streptomyces sp. NBC_00932]